MSVVTGKDSLSETSSGVLLTAHAPSGTGACGQVWIAGCAAYHSPTSLASGAGFVGIASQSSTSILTGSSSLAPDSLVGVVSFASDTYGGISLGFDATTSGGRNYQLMRIPGAWKVLKDGGVTTLGTPGASFSTGHDYTLDLQRVISGGNVELTAIIDSVSYGPYTDSSSPYLGQLYAGITAFDADTVTFKSIQKSGALSFTADNPGFLYTGYWGLENTTERHTITNASACESAPKTTAATLYFDTSTATVFPGLAYFVDRVGPTRVTLTSSGAVPITLPASIYNTHTAGAHLIKFVANVDSEYPSTHDDWTDRRDGLKFLGMMVDDGATLLRLAASPNQLEVLGDSITAALRALYTSTDGITVCTPEVCFGVVAADLLGMRPVINGHGGQGITTTATDGAPIAASAYGLVYAGKTHNPDYPPTVIVLYWGSNDTSVTSAQWQTILTTIRSQRPGVPILAVTPDGKSGLAANQSAAVTALGDALIFYRDYSAKGYETVSDSTHLTVGGHVQLGTDLSVEIQTIFNTLGIRLQASGAQIHRVRQRLGGRP